MALSDKKLLKIKVDYEVGKLSKVNICKKHCISRPTLFKQAKANGWSYQKNLQEVNKVIEEKSLDRIIEVEVDRAVRLTNQFLSDSDQYRELAMYPANEIKKAIEKLKDGGKIEKEEYDRIFSGAKVTKISMETLNIWYSGARKALGMDKDEAAPTAQTSTAIEERIKEKMKKHGFNK